MSKYGFSKGYAQTSYERLILTQPDIGFQGLWQKDGIFYIACKDIESATSSCGKPIKEWFDNFCRVIAYRVDLVESPPEGATRVPSRSPIQLSQLHGAPLNSSEFLQEIRRQLPSETPAFMMEDSPTEITIISALPLDAELSQLIEIAISNLGLDIDIRFRVDARKTKNISPGIHLPKQNLNNWPSSVIEAHEASEQQWFDNRLSLFSSDLTDGTQYIPSTQIERTACFIDCTIGHPGNIRNYLTIYSTIYLALPLSSFDGFLQRLSISEAELILLVESGRVIIVLPAETHFYEKEVLAKLFEPGRKGFVLGRQLAAASIAEGRKRNPLMYPSLDNESRRRFLDLLSASSNAESASIIKAARRYFGESWASLEVDFSTQGAKAGFNHGTGRLLSEIIYELHGRETNPIFLSCATSVEWATALRANYCPTDMPGFNSNQAASITASFITGVPDLPIIDTASQLDTIIEDLLVLDGKAPISEILEAFSEAEIERLNKILKDCNYSQDAVEAHVSKINKQVKEFERTQRDLKRRDLLALAGAILPAVALPASIAAYAAYIPFGLWLGQRMLNSDSRQGGAVTDWLKAKNAYTSTDAVFISRLRKES